MRKKIVAGNWKMNTTPSQAVTLIEKLIPLVNKDHIEVIFCIPYISLLLAKEITRGTKIKIGAQNLFYEDEGAYTGEISAPMLKEIGVSHVIIGHSERRIYFHETDEIVNKKVLKAFEHGITPIICCGESLQQREDGITIDYIKSQITGAFCGVDRNLAKNAIIAYEPIWAIGTGKRATSEQAEEVCASIRENVKEIFDEEVSESVRILYGGSVTAANAPELFHQADIDGSLVGGASLRLEFSDIVNYTL